MSLKARSTSSTYQIYVYDRQLKKYSNRDRNIDGYYFEPELDMAEKDLIRASLFESYQLLLCELTDSTCEILAIARFGKIQYIL